MQLRHKALIFIFLCAAQMISKGQQLSPRAQISLLTCAPGNALYSTFGHSAIRISDPEQDIDKVYNYGTFDFDTKHFGLKFLRGKLEYALGVSTFENFLLEYNYYKRSVWEQSLDLDQKTKSRLYRFLELNSQPENRFYLYDFFFDNCSSRIRDVFEIQIPNHIYREFPNQRPVSYRDLLDEYLVNKPWLDFGIDLIIGAIADRRADFRAQMFLPDYLHDNLESFITGKSSDARSLVQSEQLVLDFEPESQRKNTGLWISPIWFFSFLLLLELFIFLSGQRFSLRAIQMYDQIIFALFAISSLVLVFMWFGTDHQACAQNYNLLWANPLFIAGLYFLRSSKKIIPKKLLFILLGFLILTLFGWNIIPQELHFAVLPIILLMVLKCLRFLKKPYEVEPDIR